MTLLLVERARVVVTMDADRREIDQGAVLMRGPEILRVDETEALHGWMAEQDLVADEVIDASGCVLLPGLVNGHHHLYQTLTRTIGTGQGLSLFDWLKTLYPIWAEMDPECVYTSARLGLTELLLSGATTVADHLYLFPNGARLDDEIAAAAEVGIRFHPTRGSMSLGESRGGLPPDRICDSEAHILDDSLRVIQQFHDPARFSMCRIGLAPCSPFSVTAELMRQSADLARAHPAVRLHTHLAETLDEERFCLEQFGYRPLEYMEELGWVGDDVWFAHMVHPSDEEIGRLAHSCTGVCHCPSSNMILASGIAPIRAMVDRGVRVGLGVDGSASNDGNHLLGEARQTLLLQRVGWPGYESRADRFSAREALELATLGGARILGRDDIGALAPGMAADLVAFRIDDLAHAGAQSDPVSALLTCAPGSVWLSIINGVPRVRDGRLLQDDLEPLIMRHNRLAEGMLRRVGLKR